jgi:hypothetical protein
VSDAILSVATDAGPLIEEVMVYIVLALLNCTFSGTVVTTRSLDRSTTPHKRGSRTKKLKANNTNLHDFYSNH